MPETVIVVHEMLGPPPYWPYGFEIATIWYAPSGNAARASAGIAMRSASGAGLSSCVVFAAPAGIAVASGPAGVASCSQSMVRPPSLRHVPQVVSHAVYAPAGPPSEVGRGTSAKRWRSMRCQRLKQPCGGAASLWFAVT